MLSDSRILQGWCIERTRSCPESPAAMRFPGMESPGRHVLLPVFQFRKFVFFAGLGFAAPELYIHGLPHRNRS
jgi:hypothetical protein